MGKMERWELGLGLGRICGRNHLSSTLGLGWGGFDVLGGGFVRGRGAGWSWLGFS